MRDKLEKKETFREGTRGENRGKSEESRREKE